MDVHDQRQRSRNMSAIRSKNTKPEIRLAKTLYHRGHRYRKHNKKIFGTPDLSFAKHRIAIFVDSEFFHGKNWDIVEKRPKSNAEFWQKKIERNIARDKEVNEHLESQGWTVLRFWSEEIHKNLEEVVATIERILIMKKSKVVKIYPDDNLPLNEVAEGEE